MSHFWSLQSNHRHAQWDHPTKSPVEGHPETQPRKRGLRSYFTQATGSVLLHQYFCRGFRKSSFCSFCHEIIKAGKDLQTDWVQPLTWHWPIQWWSPGPLEDEAKLPTSSYPKIKDKDYYPSTKNRSISPSEIWLKHSSIPGLQLWNTSVSGDFLFDLRHLDRRQKSIVLDPQNAGNYQLEIAGFEYL